MTVVQLAEWNILWSNKYYWYWNLRAAVVITNQVNYNAGGELFFIPRAAFSCEQSLVVAGMPILGGSGVISRLNIPNRDSTPLLLRGRRRPNTVQHQRHAPPEHEREEAVAIEAAHTTCHCAPPPQSLAQVSTPSGLHARAGWVPSWKVDKAMDVIVNFCLVPFIPVMQKPDVSTPLHTFTHYYLFICHISYWSVNCLVICFLIWYSKYFRFPYFALLFYCCCSLIWVTFYWAYVMYKF